MQSPHWCSFSFWVIEALLRACKLQDSNTSSPYPLSHLRDVELAAEYWLPGDTFADIAMPFLRIRSLRRFTCAGL
ncbi:hypothetical protein BGZ57DRAFT_904249 [Hyaloscypha finlandica]|nr:hypothetical protein BGZ57DRAFT_904249 [Hyaloscypha finlandica]